MMSRLTAAVLTILLLGCGTYVLAATGGGPSGAGSAAVVQYEQPPPEPHIEVQPKHASGGHQPRNEGGSAPEHRFASVPVETAGTGPAGGSSGLPFTGLDVLGLLLIGSLLLLLGGAAQRFTRSR